jgi:hypothetical protein
MPKAGPVSDLRRPLAERVRRRYARGAVCAHSAGVVIAAHAANTARVLVGGRLHHRHIDRWSREISTGQMKDRAAIFKTQMSIGFYFSNTFLQKGETP